MCIGQIVEKELVVSNSNAKCLNLSLLGQIVSINVEYGEFRFYTQILSFSLSFSPMLLGQIVRTNCPNQHWLIP